jgi:Methyltransferase domain
MEPQLILRRKAEIEQLYGNWIAHNIQLAEGIYTISPEGPFDKTNPRRFVQAVSDIAGAPLGSLRVLDLACLEGGYAVEFALQGAQVVGIEGRRANLVKAEFAKEVLGLNNLDLFQDDVRNLNEARYGRFDVVLCCGLLYHLDVPDLFEFMQRVSDVCDYMLLLDTHVSLQPAEAVQYQGKTYHGWHYREFQPGTPSKQKEQSREASLDNDESFWLTRPSLWNLLAHVGFTTSYVCNNPALPIGYKDRDTVIALKGQQRNLIATPALNDQPVQDWPEKDARILQPAQQSALHPEPAMIRAVRRVKNSLSFRLAKLLR